MRKHCVESAASSGEAEIRLAELTATQEHESLGRDQFGKLRIEKRLHVIRAFSKRMLSGGPIGLLKIPDGMRIPLHFLPESILRIDIGIERSIDIRESGIAQERI